MTLAPDSDLKQVGIIVAKEQDARVRAIQQARRRPANPVSLSDVWREVVDLGLDAISHGPNSNGDVRNEKTGSAA